MRLPVDAIPRTGRTIQLVAGEGWARDAVSAALETEPSALSGHLEIQPPEKGGRVSVHAAVQTAGDRACDRCGEAVRFALETESDLVYMPAAKKPAEGEEAKDEEVELVEEELEIGWYADGELDLAQVVQEVVALALPPRYTCSDESACDARTEALLAASRPEESSGHPGFAALKNLKRS